MIHHKNINKNNKTKVKIPVGYNGIDEDGCNGCPIGNLGGSTI